MSAERLRVYRQAVESLHECYRNLVMDTPEDRALHARLVSLADVALAGLKAASPDDEVGQIRDRVARLIISSTDFDYPDDAPLKGTKLIDVPALLAALGIDWSFLVNTESLTAVERKIEARTGRQPDGCRCPDDCDCDGRIVCGVQAGRTSRFCQKSPGHWGDHRSGNHSWRNAADQTRNHATHKHNGYTCQLCDDDTTRQMQGSQGIQG